MIFVYATSSQNTRCPFQYLYHFGDGVTDVGNSILDLPWGPSLPAARSPYGRTFPGWPTGRWGDGLIDFDYAAAEFGFPHITPSLSSNASSSNGVIFSVARSPVLDHTFFKSRGVKIPTYAVPLSLQLSWFKAHLKSVCTSPTDCANRLGNSLILLGDIEANDVGYSLIQGKSIREVRTYVPYITEAQIRATRELINMGARHIVIPGNAIIGCFPYILTAMRSNHPDAYDNMGCLKSVNDLIAYKNDNLQAAMRNLSKEFPEVSIMYGPMDEGMRQVITETLAGPFRNTTLQACCGIGGKYNYNSRRFCGSRGVPVCSNPNNYIFWDGLHMTQEASLRIVRILIQPALSTLNCAT
ncbi:GDSL esterase/lipase [Striga hermonthica]|uniref:GDSL esterase/lipase n=1 Tax=Striga hermonthica TaxID=68872 RepID=A0A9N7NNP2_STRHE|nr:GDSL esterase/lipase [Striga hermonthica]